MIQDVSRRKGMKLRAWRGENVLVTDGAGTPLLCIDERGNVVDAVRPPPRPVEAPPRESLARSVAGWLAWTADEPGEFHPDHIHPEIRDLVLALAPAHTF
jgi:hypothetical protein